MHSILARHLHAYPELIELVRRDTISTDIFGQPGKCAEWRKLTGEQGAEHEQAFRRVDDVVARIQRFQVRPDFAQAVAERTNQVPDFNLADKAVLKRLIVLIAYSNEARAEAVTRMVREGILDSVFRGYDPQKVASLNPSIVIEAYWPKIRGIRFKWKVAAMIGCAKRVLDIQAQHGSFMQYLSDTNIPMSIEATSDLRAFWRGFDALLADLKAIEMPHFGNFTSLCHLLLDLGYDCAKPDSAIMKAAVKLGITPLPDKPGSFREVECRKVVQFMQTYAMSRGIRTAVVDLYFLIHGGQTGVAELVQDAYYL